MGVCIRVPVGTFLWDCYYKGVDLATFILRFAMKNVWSGLFYKIMILAVIIYKGFKI